MKKFLALLMAAAMTLSLAACGNSSNPGGSGSGETATIPDGKVTLKIGTSASDTSAITQGAQWFADKMSERTGGLVMVKV